MTAIASHFLAPPFGLPGGGDAALFEYLHDEAWGNAVTLLRDHVSPSTSDSRLLLLLAYARYRDATEVMFDDRLAASQEALALIDRALALGAPAAQVAPLRDEVETALDEETRAELEVLAKVPAGADLSSLPLEVLFDAGHRLSASEPGRAAELFAAAARVLEHEPQARLTAWVREGLARLSAGQALQGRALLEEALAADWSMPHLRAERHLAEDAVTALLRTATGEAFSALWSVGEALGKKHGLAFPSVWPNQETLLERCIVLRDWPKARAVARRIEEGRDVLPRALTERLRQVHLEQA